MARRLLLGAIVLAFVAQVRLTFTQNVNWDEFFFLSYVFDYARGALTSPLQSFHVHLFAWLTGIDAHEVELVFLARATYLALLLVTWVCVYLLARRTASAEASLFAVLCCAAYSNGLYHSTTFRTDGLTVTLLLMALAMLHVERRRVLALAAAACLTAVSLLITMKTVFFLPTLAVALLAGPGGLRTWRDQLREAVVYGAVLAAVGGGLYAWHQSQLAGPSSAAAVTSALERTAGKVIRRDVFMPRQTNFQDTVRGNFLQWGLIILGIAALARRMRGRERLLEAATVLALALPVLSVTFYRNAFPYYYAFVMPPALVLCAVAFDNFRETSYRVISAASVAVAVVVYGFGRAPQDTAAQQAVLAAVHQIFPQPVPYIDRAGMVSSFPKVGFFMSSWGIESYRSAGKAVFPKLLWTKRPQFLLDNTPELSSPFREGRARNGQLFSEDSEALRQSFVQYWGPIYVAGTRLQLQPGGAASWHVRIPGGYILESPAPVRIEHVVHQPGARVDLAGGSVVVQSETAQEIVLRTAQAGPRPSQAPPREQVFAPFARVSPVYLALP